MWKSVDVRRDYSKAVNTFLGTMVHGIVRGENTNGFKLQKFIESSHFIADFHEMGPLAGHGSSTGERGLKVWGKKHAVTEQHRDDATFAGQCAKNLCESIMLQKIENYHD